MKIEKINDNQIRFILNEEDLKSRQISLAELAYGTQKAKQLFRDMMQQAHRQFGFDFTDLPLMIEAIPMSGNNLVLVITKVDNPAELDSRYASFAPSITGAAQQEQDNTSHVLDQLFDSIRQSPSPENAHNTGSASGHDNDTAGAGTQKSGRGRSDRDKTDAQRREEYFKLREYIMTHRLYIFPSLDAVIAAASKVQSSFTGKSDLLQDKSGKPYYLFLTMKNMEEVSDMQSVLALISEYGRIDVASYARGQQLSEHSRLLIRGDAIQKLAGI